MDNPFLHCRRASCSGPGLTTSFPHFPRRAERPICRPAAAPLNGVSAAAGRRGLGAGPRPPSAAGSEMRKNEFMPPASPEGHRTRNQVLTFLIEIAELSVHYFPKPSSVRRTIRARRACFRLLLPPPAITSSRPRCSSETSKSTPVRIVPPRHRPSRRSVTGAE